MHTDEEADSCPSVFIRGDLPGGIVFIGAIIVHGCRHFFGFILILLRFTLNIFPTTIYASSLTKTKAKGVVEQLCPAW